MSYGEVVTMFPMTRTVFAQQGIVEKPNFYYVPIACFLDAYEISLDELNKVVEKTEEKRPECTVNVNGEVLSDQMTFTEILSAHPRVRGIFETYGIYDAGKRNMNWKKETLGSIALSLNITPEKFLNQIASCIKAPFFPLGNVFVLTMATLAFGLSFGLWVVMGPLSSIIKTEFALSFTKLYHDSIANTDGFCYEDPDGDVNRCIRRQDNDEWSVIVCFVSGSLGLVCG